MKIKSHFYKHFFLSLFALYAISVLTIITITRPLTQCILTFNLKEQATALTRQFSNDISQEELIALLQKKNGDFSFRTTLITKSGDVLFESLALPSSVPIINYYEDHQEIQDAFTHGLSYSEHFSHLALRPMAYVAIRLDQMSPPLVLRAAFPMDPILQLEKIFSLGLFIFSSLFILIFGVILWRLMERLNAPLKSFLSIVSSYQQAIHHPQLLKKMDSVADTQLEEVVHTINQFIHSIQESSEHLIREQNEKQTLLASMTDGVASLDPYLNVLYVNHALTEILQTDEQWVGKPFPEKQFEDISCLLRNCQISKQKIYEEQTVVINGQTLRLEVLVNYKIDQQGFMLIIRDRTQHYKLHEMRKAFVANASHELKTPITVIRGFAETLRDNNLPINTIQQITETILKNCSRMEDLIRALLTLANAENMPLHEKVDYSLIILTQDVIERVKFLFPAAQIKLHTPEKDITILCLPDLLQIALYNLLENAAKYSPHPAHIDIYIRNSGHEVMWEISDKGIGIPEADRPYIFERFYTVDKARSKKLGGYGLGLSLVKTIIEKHSGHIQVESNYNKGTTFTIFFKPEKPILN